jgi:hypothetical protein
MQPSRNGDSSRNTTNEYRRLQFRPTAADRVTILAEIESEEAAVVNLDYGLTLPPHNESSVSPMTTCQQVAIQDRNESISSPSRNIVESNQAPLYPQSCPNHANAELSDAVSKGDRSGRGKKSSNVSGIESFRDIKSP